MKNHRPTKKGFKILLIACVILGLIRIVMFVQEYLEQRTATSPGTLTVKLAAPPPKPPLPTEAKPEEKITDGLLIGRYVFKASRPLNPDSEVGYIIPVDEKGKPLPGASDMIFYGPYNGEGYRIAPGTQPWLQALAKRNSCTVFSLKIIANTDITDDRETYYVYPEAGWFDLVFAAQQKLTRKFSFPEKKLILLGMSSGGSMAQNMIAARPEKIEAAVWNGGSRYDTPDAKSDHIPRLMINTWGCPGEPATAELARKLQQRGAPVLFTVTGPNPELKKNSHHDPGPDYYTLMEQYLQSILRLRRENHGKLPPAKQWPCRNGDEYFPDAEFARCWQQRFPRRPEWDSSRLFGVYPVTGTGRRLAIIFVDDDKLEEPFTLDIFYLLSRQSAVPVVIPSGDNLADAAEKNLKALSSVLHDDRWKDLPVYIIGLGRGGQLGAVTAMGHPAERNIKKITLFDPNMASPFPLLSIEESRKKSSIPLVVYLDQAPKNTSSDPVGIHFRTISPNTETNQSRSRRIIETVTD